MRKHWKKILVVSGIVVLVLAVIAVSVVILYKIQDEDLRNILVPIIASVYGGVLTLGGVAWTIIATNKENHRRDDLNIRPIPIYLVNRCYGFSEVRGHLISVNAPSEDGIRYYRFKNIGSYPFEVKMDAVKGTTTWVQSGEEFSIGLLVENTTDVVKIQFNDMIGNPYIFELSFSNVFGIKDFKLIGEK